MIESGRLYRSNLIEDVPLVLSLTHFFSGEQKLRLQGGVKDLYANSVTSTQLVYTVGDPIVVLVERADRYSAAVCVSRLLY